MSIFLLCAAAAWLPAQEMMEAPPRREAALQDRSQRLREAVGRLDLSPQQRAAVEKLFEAEESAEADPAAARRQRLERARRMRQGLAEILTPAQVDALREAMQQQPSEPPPAAPKAPPATPPSSPPAPMQPPMAPDEMDASPPPIDKPANAQPGGLAAALRKRPPIAEGAPAPELSAVNERSRPVKLAGLPRKPVVIVFGSWSCPSFRQRLPQLERLAATYQKRVHFLVIYTREAHAVGEWEVERNRDEQIQIAQPADLAGRIERATAATSPVLKAFELAIDDMSDATVRAYGLFPNGAVVLKPDRTIAGVQRWVDPFTLDQLIDAATGR